MLGEERVIVYDQAGTTRDSIYIPFERDDEKYTLIDTAGVRRRGKIFEAVEKFSVVKTLQAIQDSNVVVRSEEHTSELQSLMRISYAVFCLEKKNYNNRHETRCQFYFRTTYTTKHTDTHQH